MSERLRVGLIVNPVAGIGGTAALRGSDGATMQREAIVRGAVPRAGERARRAFVACAPVYERIVVRPWGGAMGEDAVAGLPLACEVLGGPGDITTADDTRRAAACLVAGGIDLLVFAGGDGTARDLLGSIPAALPVLGIPAGVKMQSGVFAVTPEDAGALIVRLAEGGLVAAEVAEIRDRDDTRAAEEGEPWPSRWYGDVRVPRLGGHLQHVKSGGHEVEALVLTEIAAWIAERVAALGGVQVIGPGSTTMAIKERLGIAGTLLGTDVVRDGRLQAADADARTLEAVVTEASVIVVSFTRRQGFLFGRGNQPLTPSVIRRVPRSHLWVVGSRTKLASLEGRPLYVDTGDSALDRELRGLIEVVTGYEDLCLYRVA